MKSGSYIFLLAQISSEIPQGTCTLSTFPYFLHIFCIFDCYLFVQQRRRTEDASKFFEGSLPQTQGASSQKRRIIMKNSILIAALLAAAVVCSALYAVAADPLSGSAVAVEKRAGDGPATYDMRKERHFDRMAEALDLTPEQREQIKAIRAAEQEKVEPLRQQMQEGREQLRAVAEQQPFDEAAVRTLAAGQAEIRTEMIVSHARVRNQINALLTPEQREQAEKLGLFMKERRGFKGHRR
jgi:Spy/CpxP family protein refolding chaperone